MGSIIKRLPETLRSRIRSGVILYDFTRVVEELVFNSLDAGATKVSVAVGVGTCYAKVDDNGSGIARDGLVLIGERYVTSKYSHLDDMHAFPASFGFKGEALSSISDVSLLEIVTKTHGRPNGYRKVLKDGKCLYLGIDNERQDVGTTVVVRDLFYNQPVRRKQMHSNPKRVLHSLKECLIRIALVHPSVSFKVVDIESEDDLLCTHASPSPLLLLSSGFGIQASSSLNKLNANDGSLKLSGYISGPQDVYIVKVLQYFYINSRYVSKGPIHKLLNNLATSFGGASDIEKQSRSQIYPVFLLNLNCPRSFYDFSLEPSRTSVEFKDWRPVLFFIEDAVTNLWTESKSVDHVNYEIQKKRCRAQSNKASVELPSLRAKRVSEDRPVRRNIQSSPTLHWGNASEKLDPEFTSLCQSERSNGSIDGSLPHCTKGVNQISGSSLQPSSCNVSFTKDADFLENNFIASSSSHYKSDSEKLDREFRFLCQTERSNRSIDGSLAHCTVGVKRKSGSSLQPSSCHVSFIEDDDSLDNNFNASSSSCYKTDYLSLWEDESPTFFAGRSTDTASFREPLELSDSSNVTHDRRKPFLRSCSLHRSLLLHDGASFASHEDVEFKNSDYRDKQDILEDDYSVEFELIDDVNQVLNQRFPRGKETYFENLPRCKTQSKALQRSKIVSRDSEKFSITENSFDEDNHLLDFVEQTGKYGSSMLSLSTGFQDFEPYIVEDEFETSVKHELGVTDNFGNSKDNLPVSALNNLGKEDCLFPNSAKFSSDLNFYACSKENMSSIVGHNPQDIYSSGPSEFYYDGGDLSHIPSHSEEYLNYHLTQRAMLSSRVDEDSHKWIDAGNRGKKNELKRKSRRSHSAPPFYLGKKKFFAMGELTRETAGNTNLKTVHDVPLLPETRGVRKLQHSAGAICWELPQQSSHQCDQSSTPSFPGGVSTDDRPNVEKKLVNIWNSKLQTQGECESTHDLESNEEFTSTKTQDFSDSGTKWKDYCPETAVQSKKGAEDLKSQDTILNITYGVLHFVGDSLIPDTIDKSCLEGAKVLQQVDKKFIPIVAGTTLAIIDQHAADERIRLEELRDKVLSGQMRTTTYLDSEQELVMPETGYQLLHNYAEQIQRWGWICNIHSQASGSFTRNLNLIHKQPEAVTLLAVPCILGVNLTDVDLLEFVQQLADTDGSSIIPPSVNRLLNNKACRGAIMFGDALLPSECSLIVEELKKTSLCFQCAHGRPTTVPLVNLDALRKHTAKLGSWSGVSSESWHGLHRNEISLERAASRLRSAVS